MDMGMKQEFLVPGVEHAEEADLGPEMGGVARDFQQSFGAGPEQQTVDEFPVLEGDRSQLWRQGEDDVGVGRGQQFPATRCDAAFTRPGLTLRAVPIAATVVRDGGTMSAAGALIDMATEGSGATVKSAPALRMMSATSNCGRFIYFSSDDLPFFSTSASSGLGVACRCRCERWR